MNLPFPIRVIALLAASLGLASAANAAEARCAGCEAGFALAEQAAPPFDEATGEGGRQFAPDPQVDFTHLKLDIDLLPQEKRLDITETLSFETTRIPLAALRLDAVGMTVKSVTIGDDAEIDWRHDAEELTIRFNEPLPPETKHELTIEYAVQDPISGLTFALPNDAYPDRPLHIHSQGQPEQNRHWVICHDYPNERMTTEIVATVPAGLKVLANGERLGDPKENDGDTVTWHYKMQKPHVSYLISMVVGEFDVVEEEWNGHRVEYWVPPGRADDVERTYGNTENMLDFFSEKLGEYPWQSYSQSVVYSFGSGGMENTTVTTMYEDAIFDERGVIGNSLDGLIAHELAHQWFGDHTTCKTWAHLWLNEGFATYLDSAWHEHFHGRDEYAYEVYTNMRSVAASDDVTAPGGLVYPYYETARETFRRRVSNPYGKGAAVIHMLRQTVGDDALFWDALKAFQSEHALTPVEADELRMVFEDVTGRDYEQFWRQWVYRPGAPTLDIDYRWNGEAGQVELDITQTQPIAAEYPAFEHPLEVWAVMADGQTRKFTIDLNGTRTDATLSTGEEPTQIVVNPQSGLLATLDFSPPVMMTIEQAKSGPTPFAKLQAIDRLGASRDGRALETLTGILADGERHWGQRAEAARSLGRIDSDAARDALLQALETGLDEPRVRREAVEAAAGYKSPQVAEVLLDFAKEDESLYVEAAALAGLADQAESDEIIELLLEKTGDRSWGHRVRQSAVAALADLGEMRGLEPAMALGGYGGPFRARGTGIDAIGKLYTVADDEKKAEIREFLLGLVDDPMERHAMAAINTLGATGDEEAVKPLQRLADSSRPEAFREAARDAIRQISEGGEESSLIRDLRQRLRRLEDTRDVEQAEKREKAIEAGAPGEATTREAA